MSPTKCDARGSPRVFKAAFMLFTSKETVGMNDAMKLAEYTQSVKFLADVFERVFQRNNAGCNKQMEKGTARKLVKLPAL
jgi:hypothetical protein